MKNPHIKNSQLLDGLHPPAAIVQRLKDGHGERVQNPVQLVKRLLPIMRKE
jgi:hypothetical protein